MDILGNQTLAETNLKQLIEEFRRSRTINEERMTIQKHRGFLRENMKKLDNEQRAEGILKLIWMNMLGYDTEFALVECMNSLFIDNFRLKIIAYMGLTLFLSRKSEVLLMVTNRIRIDLEDQTNDFIVSTALKTFSEIADENMCVELFPILLNLLQHDSKYVRKKVCLAIYRVLSEKPDMAIELKPSIQNLLSENNNGLLMCTIHMIHKVMLLRPKAFHGLISDSVIFLITKLRKTTIKNSGNYMINGINDPFLQTALIDFLVDFINLEQTKSLENYEDILSEFESCLLTIYNEIQEMNGTTARSILYSVTRTIMQLPSTHALKKVGIAILGSFLQMKNKNYLFVSLKMLVFISKKYSSEVSRHNAMIMKCVNDKDFSLKKLALEILLNTTNSENIHDVSQLFFNELSKEKNPRKAEQMANQNLKLIQKIGNNKLEMIDLIFKLMQSLQNGIKINFSLLYPLFYLVANGTQTQMFASLTALKYLGNRENLNKPTLLFACYWILGEFAEVLTIGLDIKSNRQVKAVSWDKIIDIMLLTFEEISQQPIDVTMYILTSLLKIFHKTNQVSVKQKIINLLINMAKGSNNSASQKARQYLRLMKFSPNNLEEILESVGYSNESFEQKFNKIEEGQFELDVINKFADDINSGNFVNEKQLAKVVVKNNFDEDLVVQKNVEDVDLLNLENNNGLQNDEGELEDIDLLGFDIGPSSNANDNEDEIDNMMAPVSEAVSDPVNKNDNYDVDLLDMGNKNDLMFGDEVTHQTNMNLNNQAPEDMLDLTMDTKPVKKTNILDGGINDMLNFGKEQTVKQNSNSEIPKPKKIIGKPKSKKQTNIPRVNSLEQSNDLDLIGDTMVSSQNTVPSHELLDDLDLMSGNNPQTPVTTQSNEYDDLDFISPQPPSMTSPAPITTNENDTLTFEKKDNYGALDQLDDILIRGTTQTVPPQANIMGNGVAPNNTDNYDCLNINNPDTLLGQTTNVNNNNLINDADDDFGDEEFVESEVQNVVPIQNFIEFFQNEDIKLEHVTNKEGLNKYTINNFFTNKTAQNLLNLKLNVSVQSHIKVLRNTLTSTNLGPFSSRTISLNLVLEDSTYFMKPLKIKMILKYQFMGQDKEHKFIVSNF